MKRKPPTKEQLDAWQVDQLDPDNWYQIPEFGVLPADVGFAGFAFPVVSPHDGSRYEAHQHVRALLGVARRLARRDFVRLEDVRRAGLEAMDLLEEGKQPSAKQACALLYNLVDQNWSSAIRPTEAARQFEYFASQAATIASWAAGDFGGALQNRLQAIRQGGVLGGLRSAKTRRLKALDKDQVERAARRLGWPGLTRGINKLVSQGFDATPRRIGQILKERLPAK